MSSQPQSDNMFCSSSELTNTFGASGTRLKAVIALTAVTSHCIDTAPVLTDARLGATLVQVCQYTEQKDGRMKTVKRRKNLSHWPKETFLYLPIQPSPSGRRCMPGGQIHMKVPIRFLQVMPLESQSSRPSKHSSWSGGRQ